MIYICAKLMKQISFSSNIGGDNRSFQLSLPWVVDEIKTLQQVQMYIATKNITHSILITTTILLDT
jgi:hypothetical protein